MVKQRLKTLIAPSMGSVVVWLTVVGCCFVGYMLNLVAIVSGNLINVNALMVFRLIGVILFPIGSVLGYI